MFPILAKISLFSGSQKTKTAIDGELSAALSDVLTESFFREKRHASLLLQKNNRGIEKV